MAKNYTIKEATNIIVKGTDTEALADIGRRYPLLARKLTVLATMAPDELADLMGFMPDYLTANKVNNVIKSGVADSGDETDEADEADEDATTEEAAEPAAKWDESMSAKQLWDILGKAGKRKLAKSTKKADLVAACKEAFGEAEADDDSDDEDETEMAEEASNPYEGKSAVELFKLCKERGVKAAPKKPAKYYVDLLNKADAEADSTEEEESWGDEEQEEKPTKKTKVEKPAKANKKVAKADEDDWDI